MDRLNKQHSKVDSLVTSSLLHPLAVLIHPWQSPALLITPDVICRHGGVLPSRVDTAPSLATAVPQPGVELLHMRFGGGPFRLAALQHLHGGGEGRDQAEGI